MTNTNLDARGFSTRLPDGTAQSIYNRLCELVGQGNVDGAQTDAVGAISGSASFLAQEIGLEPTRRILEQALAVIELEEAIRTQHAVPGLYLK